MGSLLKADSNDSQKLVFFSFITHIEKSSQIKSKQTKLYKKRKLQANRSPPLHNNTHHGCHGYLCVAVGTMMEKVRCTPAPAWQKPCCCCCCCTCCPHCCLWRTVQHTRCTPVLLCHRDKVTVSQALWKGGRDGTELVGCG